MNEAIRAPAYCSTRGHAGFRSERATHTRFTMGPRIPIPARESIRRQVMRRSSVRSPASRSSTASQILRQSLELTLRHAYGEGVSIPLRVVQRLGLGLVLALTAISRSLAGEAEVSPDVLDELEQRICIADQNATNATRELARGQQIPVESVTGQSISDPRRREYLQQRLDAVLTGAQKALVAEHRRQFDESQQQYRTLVGREFDLSLCGQADRRMKRREGWEAKRQEAELQQQADRLAGSDSSMLSAACRELTIMKGPPPEARAAFKESDVQYWQARARENYERLSRSYEARTGNRFDPARCPK